MTSSSADLSRFAEDPMTFVPPEPGQERIEDPRFVVTFHKGSHDLVVDRTGPLGESHRGVDRGAPALARRGARASLVDVEGRRFGDPDGPGGPAGRARPVPARKGPVPPGAGLDEGRPIATGRAWFSPFGVYLGGGATLPSDRGRGAMTALLWGSWEEAVRRGTPALVTHGGAMSSAILRRLGFRKVGEVVHLIDRADDGEGGGAP